MHEQAEGGEVKRLTELAGQWNATTHALDALWESSGNPGGGEWRELSRTLYERQLAIEDELGPLLLEWAEANNLGRFVGGLTRWSAHEGCYRTIRELTGLEAHGNTLRAWLSAAGEQDSLKAWEELLRSLADAELAAIIESICAVLPEELTAKRLFLRLRLEHDGGGEGARDPVMMPGPESTESTADPTALSLAARARFES